MATTRCAAEEAETHRCNRTTSHALQVNLQTNQTPFHDHLSKGLARDLGSTSGPGIHVSRALIGRTEDFATAQYANRTFS